MKVRFLTARWSNLALLNYPVPAEAFAPYLPPGCEADLGWDGRAWASLVAFDFLETRVLGVPWPGFRNFPEINLRLYVRHVETGDRGVVFVKELVPQRFVAAMARLTYNEPYEAVPMRSSVTRAGGEIRVWHGATFAGRENTIAVTAADGATETPTDGVEHFFKEHRWGFNRSRGGRLVRYEVSHPRWRCYPVRSHATDWDFGAIYGERWAFLRGRTPESVVLAEGSAVEVFVWQSSVRG